MFSCTLHKQARHHSFLNLEICASSNATYFLAKLVMETPAYADGLSISFVCCEGRGEFPVLAMDPPLLQKQSVDYIQQDDDGEGGWSTMVAGFTSSMPTYTFIQCSTCRMHFTSFDPTDEPGTRYHNHYCQCPEEAPLCPRCRYRGFQGSSDSLSKRACLAGECSKCYRPRSIYYGTSPLSVHRGPKMGLGLHIPNVVIGGTPTPKQTRNPYEILEDDEYFLQDAASPRDSISPKTPSPHNLPSGPLPTVVFNMDDPSTTITSYPSSLSEVAFSPENLDQASDWQQDTTPEIIPALVYLQAVASQHGEIFTEMSEARPKSAVDLLKAQNTREIEDKFVVEKMARANPPRSKLLSWFTRWLK